jgi:hypothetical protein
MFGSFPDPPAPTTAVTDASRLVVRTTCATPFGSDLTEDGVTVPEVLVNETGDARERLPAAVEDGRRDG